MKHLLMSLTKMAPVLLFGIMIAACKLRPDNSIINTAAIHFSSVFITQNVQSVQSLRVKGNPVVKNETDSLYLVTGLIEGYSPMYYPVSIDHFSERLQYLGGNPNEQESWKCVEIDIRNKKVK
jgi:hypothetical protein